MVDKARLDQILANLATYLAVLDDLATVPRVRFLAARDTIASAKYHFIIAIECCISIANHIIASEGYRFPADNADSFVVLVEEGILDAAEKDPLGAMARFRNRLVHLYWQIDDERVYEYLQQCRGDLERYSMAIASRSW